MKSGFINAHAGSVPNVNQQVEQAWLDICSELNPNAG